MYQEMYSKKLDKTLKPPNKPQSHRLQTTAIAQRKRSNLFIKMQKNSKKDNYNSALHLSEHSKQSAAEKANTAT
jgi:hypothetical protein